MQGERLTLGVSDSAKPVIAAYLWQRTRLPTLLLVPRESDAEEAVDVLRAWLGDAVQHFPARASLSYARDAAPPAFIQRRLTVLTMLLQTDQKEAPPLVVASVAAATGITARRADLGAGLGRIAIGDQINVEVLAGQLVDAGYVVGPLVEKPGEAARRGGIVDVFPPTAQQPVRIELYGDEVHSIRCFDPATQRSTSQLNVTMIGAAREWFPTKYELIELADRLAAISSPPEEIQDELSALRRGELPAPSRYGPLVGGATLFDHFDKNGLLLLDEEESVLATSAEQDELTAERRDLLINQSELAREAPMPHLSEQELIQQIDRRSPRAIFARWAAGVEEGSLRLQFSPHDAYAGRLNIAVAQFSRQLRRGDRIVVVTQQAQRFRELLADSGIIANVTDGIAVPPGAGELALVQGSLPGGWHIKTPQGELALVTDHELFGFVRKRRALRKNASHRAQFLADIAPGDFVVHADHGIARFGGIVRRNVGSEQRDYLQLRYAGEDRLYVPVQQIDRVNRYVAGSDHIPRLTRLGTQEWSRTRTRVREAIDELAADLIRLYAARQLLRGHAFSLDTEWQREMEAAFPYQETLDQERAIIEVKRDMESQRPMDRIVLGDVGFGKTEVAVRAAFKAVQDGYQVAILVPTTVLAQQHERTFRERLAPFPVNIEVLSRFRTDTEARRVIEGLRDRSVDIVIGTHRLLQIGIEFSNLGLVIVDEEQRFGVAHKERLKRMRLEVDVLTLSATPIPRTLHMSLAGIRDMSTMDSAPEDRLPVQTFVAEWDDLLVREAVLGEIERGGQVYLVHNRVHTINGVADRLRALVPESRVVVGHGQMPKAVLRKVMEQFALGDADVLVCTTIIESGIDIPNVNTLIVDQADRLGLAQLYQLRGRVGRGSQQAQAYLLHHSDRILNDVAQQRLATIFEATELGAGFQVALRDLEIRGAGNLLGTEQSGQIAAVGFDLYTQMLTEAVEGLRARQEGRPARKESPSVVLDLPVSAFIPESYIHDLEARVALYQRIGGIREFTEEDELRIEVADRFGELPSTVIALLDLVRIRLAAMQARVSSIRIEGGEIVLSAQEGASFQSRLLPRLPEGVHVGHSQLRLPYVNLGAELLATVEELLQLLGDPSFGQAMHAELEG